MNDNKETLILNLDKVHTTEMGLERIKRNLSLDTQDVVEWCKQQIKKTNNIITRKGKNWYVNIDNCVITVNAYSYTIITAHKLKKSRSMINNNQLSNIASDIEDKNTRYYIDLDLNTRQIINWAYGQKNYLDQTLANPCHQRVFINKGQYHKLIVKLKKCNLKNKKDTTIETK